MDETGSSSTAAASGVVLQLLGRFCVRCAGEQLTIPPAGQKLLALVALQGGAAHRSRLACAIWEDSDDQRALANLRGAMWRLPDPIRSRLARHGSAIAFIEPWTVDVGIVAKAADSLKSSNEHCAVDSSLFALDLLPDWDAEWLTVLREQHRQLRLHALESLTSRQLDNDKPLDAVDTAMMAVSADPLRESAQILLLRAHLQAGNRAAVVRHFEYFEERLDAELRLKPSPEMAALVAQVHS